MRADRGAQRQKERQRRKPVILRGAVQVTVENPISQMRQPAMLKIHQHKCEVIEYVDAGEVFGELQAIEQGRLAVEEANVAKVEIAMAMAHLAGRTPPIDQLPKRGQLLAPLHPDRIDPLRVET